MESYSPVPLVKQGLNTPSDVVRKALLLLAVLRELLSLILSLLRGSLSLEDAHERLKGSQVAYFPPPEGVKSDSPASASKSLDSEGTLGGDWSALAPNQTDLVETTWNAAEPKATVLVDAVRIFCRTIVQRDSKSVARMLEAAPRLVVKRHESGWYPLHAAVLSADVELVKLILSHPKVDVNVAFNAQKSTTSEVQESELGISDSETSGATPLHYACMVGNAEIIRLLVEHGAFITAVDSKKREPFEYFDIRRDLEAVSVFHDLYTQWKKRDDFYKEYSHVNDFAALIREDEYEVFERCIKKSPGVASKLTEYDFTLLHLAVIRQRRRFVGLLISIDKSLVNELDERAYWSTSYADNSFAPPNIPHKYVKNATALHYACLVQDMEIVGMLLEAGADWTIKDAKGRLPEELIYTMDATCNELKASFTRLRDAEDEKRKKRAEEKRGKGDKMNIDPSTLNGSLSKGVSEEDDSDHGDSGSDRTQQPANQGACAPAKVSIESLLSLETALSEKLVGQQGPIRVVANAIRLRESEWVDPDHPLTMLFLGSSGVGKTELAKQLALYLHGKDGLATNKGESVSALEKNHGFVRIDMSEFQERHTAMNLIGAPKSYVGYGEGGALTKPLKKNPRAVVLLDEIEKAHPDVLNTFLQVFDDGRITDSKDGVICCKDAIFIMTSNIAADRVKEEAPMLRQLVAQSEKEGRPESYVHLIRDFTRSIHPELKRHLRRDEFVGRINQIVVFLPLNQEEIELTVQRELAMWRKRAEEKHKISLTWTDDVVRKLALAYDVNYGVRSVANEVQRIAVQLIAEAHIRGQISNHSHTSLTTNEVGDIMMNAFAKDADVKEPEKIVDTSDTENTKDNMDTRGE